ncbi:MAG: nitrous oxide-stimulated promoter family protein [Bacteroidales bacterium]|nr:nitrous oxide-stimulated promoter family protein [Bacteroidales bacterium]
MHPRIEREKKIVNLMISNFCLDVHEKKELCEECNELRDYAEKRLLSCPFIKNKPVCSSCNIHCYNKHQQDKIKDVMRTVGPRMIYSHTKDALWYLFYKFIHKNQRIA